MSLRTRLGLWLLNCRQTPSDAVEEALENVSLILRVMIEERQHMPLFTGARQRQELPGLLAAEQIVADTLRGDL